MLELYHYIRNMSPTHRAGEYQEVILTNIRTMFSNSAPISRIITDKFLNGELWVLMVQEFYRSIYEESWPNGAYVYHGTGPMKLLFIKGEFQYNGRPFPVREFKAFDNLSQLLVWSEKYRSDLTDRWYRYIQHPHSRWVIDQHGGLYVECVTTYTVSLTEGNLNTFTRYNDIVHWARINYGQIPDPEHFISSEEQLNYFEEDIRIRRGLVIRDEVEQYLQQSKLIRD